MKKIVASITLLATLLTGIRANSQRLSLDVMPGLINYAGDLQPSSITLKEAGPAIAAGLSYKLGSNWYIRGSYLVGQIQADDKKNEQKYISRNLNFKSIILEGSFSLEYDFFKFREDKKWTPYIFAGLGYFYFCPYTHDTAGNKLYLAPYGTEGQGLAQYPDRKFYSLYQFNIPMGLGAKYAINDNWAIGFEFCARKLFTDYLDDVSTFYPDEQALLNARGPKAVELSFRGGEINPNAVYTSGAQRGGAAKDYYYTGLVRLTYTFAGKGSSFGGYKKSVSCPRPVY